MPPKEPGSKGSRRRTRPPGSKNRTSTGSTAGKKRGNAPTKKPSNRPQEPRPGNDTDNLNEDEFDFDGDADLEDLEGSGVVQPDDDGNRQTGGDGQEKRQPAVVDEDDDEEPRPTIPQRLLTRLLQESFEKDNTSISKDAQAVVAKYMDVFVREAIARAASESKGTFLDVRSRYPL